MDHEVNYIAIVWKLTENCLLRYCECYMQYNLTSAMFNECEPILMVDLALVLDERMKHGAMDSSTTVNQDKL